MTRTKEQLRKAVFGKLQSLRRKLLARGVLCTYARSVLSHENGDTSFTITCRLADDQATLLPQVVVRTAEGTQTFDHLAFDQGLTRLQELFRDQGGGNGDEAGSDTQANTNGQATDSHDAESDSSRVVDQQNQTPFSHEGDAK
jgi:hypothetical protein